VFLDSYFATNYTSDWQIGRLLSFFTALAVIIAAMGLFGYTSLSIVHKTKEIGIRKVLGASSISNAIILSREYLIVLLASVVISIPTGSYISAQILQQYAFQVSQTVLTFVLPVAVLLTILALTITSQVIKSVLTNPVDSLRYE
jgi:putative ABC transport system permease protein